MPEAPRTPFFFNEKRKEEKTAPVCFPRMEKKDGRAGIERGFKKKPQIKTRTAERWRAAFERKGNGKYKREGSVRM